MESSLSYHGDLEKEVEDVQSGNGDERKCLPVFASWRSLWRGCDDGMSRRKKRGMKKLMQEHAQVEKETDWWWWSS